MTKTAAAIRQHKINGNISRDTIFEAYSQVIVELGENAPYMAKSRIYQLVGQKVNLTPDHCRNVIRKGQGSRT